MVQVLVILCFAALHLHDYARVEWLPRTLDPIGSTALTNGPLVVLWLVAHAAALNAGRRMDRRGDRSAQWSAERFANWVRIIGTLHFAGCVLVLGWLDAVRSWVGDLVLVDEAAALLPMLIFFAAGWWSLQPLEVRVREAFLARQLYTGAPVYPPRSRGKFVIDAIRHQLLLIAAPLLLMTAWQEAAARWGERLLGRVGIATDWGLPVLTILGVLAVFVVMPPLLRRIWDTAPIEGGEFASAVERMCAKHGVRMRRPLMWRTSGSMVNGAVLGMVWPFRYLLFTDALFDRLSPLEAEAVAAHEVGHIRRKHIFWSAVFVGGALLLFEWLAAVGARLLGWSDENVGGAGLGVAVLLGTVWTFGFISRRFEWQADAFAAVHMSEAYGGGAVSRDAVVAMTGALRAVAEVNGVPLERFSFRHGSIAERIDRLQGLEGVRVAEIPIDRQVRMLKVAGAFALAAGVALTVL